MIVISSLKFSEDQKNRERFSKKFPKFSEIFKEYTENIHLKYRFQNNDFYFREHLPNVIDYIINIWVLGIIDKLIKR